MINTSRQVHSFSVTMENDWKRPDSVPYPNVWLRCKGKKAMADGKIPEFRIQDVTEDMYEEIVGYMCNIFVRDENLASAMKVADDPVSSKEFEEMFRKYLKYNITVVAVVEDDATEDSGKRPRIAGCNILGVTRKSDPKITSDKFKGQAAGPVMRFILDFGLKDVDIFELYGVDEYISAFGLFVHPDFRGQGLAVHLLKARFPLAKALGVKATMTFFTPIAAQVASEKAGMKLIKEVVYEEYKENGKVVFPNIKNRSMKVMGARIQ